MRSSRPAATAICSLLCAGVSAWSPASLAQSPAPTPVAAAPENRASGSSFKITFDAGLQPEPYSGRVYIALSEADGRRDPRLSMGDWFGGSQVFSLDVANIAPGGSVTVGPGSLGFPVAYEQVESRPTRVQAIARRSPDSPKPGAGPGDLVSEPVAITFDRAAKGVIELKLSKAIKARAFKETDRVKLFEMESPALTTFAGRSVKSRAAVVLPKDWKDDPAKRYPTLYWIGGFGGDHFSALSLPQMMGPAIDDLLVVVPDPTCYLGHSVFADSANNGPRGHALVRELAPALEKQFHGAQSGRTRFVSGISSGGWACLWLQVTYPDDFNGCWSHCPDPIDFRDFQRINLYAGNANMYRDEKGERRPLARQGDRVMLWYDDFVRQETVMGPGGQIHSFEAVFSPRLDSGLPRPLFDRSTGAVDPATAKSWEKYDIRLILDRNWDTLGPRLKGKIRIYAGGQDTFYLEGAAALVKESLATRSPDSIVEIVPGMPHTVLPQGMKTMFEEIRDRSGLETPAAVPAAPH